MDWTRYAEILGASYGALQVLAQLLMTFLPTNTIAWKVSKAVVSGPARPQS